MPAQEAIPPGVRRKLLEDFDKAGFMDRYGADLWVVIIAFTCVFLHVCRTQIKSFLNSLKPNWNVNRKNPLYMPIAGYVHRNPGQTPAEATMDNFSDSIGDIVTEVVRIAMLPLLFALSALTEVVTLFVEVLNMIRALFNYLRNMIAKIVQDAVSRAEAIIVPMQTIVHSAQGLLGKMGGLLAGMSYIGSGAFLTVGSALMWLVSIVLEIMLIIVIFVAAMIALAIVLYLIPFGIGAALSRAVVALTVVPGIFILLFILPLYIITSLIVNGVLDAHTKSAPSIPMCFDGNTRIGVHGKDQPVPLRSVRPGDMLRTGDRVTAVFKLLAKGQDVCKLGSTVVTGNHSVLHPTRGWIASRDHPDAVPVPDYDEEHVYCMNTSSKRICLDGMTFADWDDLDEADFETLQHSAAPLPARFGPQDIHPFLASGHRATAKVRLADGSSAAICSVEPGTRLAGGGTCLGHVQLLPNDSARDGVPAHHLVVDSGRFVCDGSLVSHYDACIETYLSTPDASSKFLSSASL